MSIFVLAYGGFHFADEARDVDVALSTLGGVVGAAVLAYVPSTLLAEKMRGVRRVYALPAYFITIGLLTPAFGVKGAPGPAHVAMAVGVWIVPALLAVLIAKLLLLWLLGRRSRVDEAAHVHPR